MGNCEGKCIPLAVSRAWRSITGAAGAAGSVGPPERGSEASVACERAFAQAILDQMSELASARAALETALLKHNAELSEDVVELAVRLAEEAARAATARPVSGIFSEPASLFATLRPMAVGRLAPVRLLSSTWIKRRAALVRAATSVAERRRLALPRRQDLERDEPSAFLTVEEVEALPRAASTGCLALGVWSHCWLTADHPDPLGEQLLNLATAIEMAEAGGAGGSQPFPDRAAFFIDFACVHQRDTGGRRLARELAAYQQALWCMHRWYAHKLTTVFLSRVLPPGCETLAGFYDRGWPTCEIAWAGLAKARRSVGWATIVDVLPVVPLIRHPPLAPAEMARLLAGKRFSSRATDLPTLIELHSRAVVTRLRELHELCYAGLQWADEDVGHFCELLPLCTSASSLMLYSNRIGDRGIRALARALAHGALPQLACLYLDENQIGDEGMKALCKSLTRRPLNQLTKLNLGRNQIGDKGLLALSALLSGKLAVGGNATSRNTLSPLNGRSSSLGGGAAARRLSGRALASLRVLDLEANQIGDIGLSSLSGSINSVGNLEVLRLGHNRIGDNGIKRFAAALAGGALTELRECYLQRNALSDRAMVALARAMGSKALSKLRCLDLEYNKIGGVGMQALASVLSRGALACLQALYLNNNRIGDDGLRAFSMAITRSKQSSSCDVLPGLQVLRLNSNQIGDAGIGALSSAISLGALEQLSELYLSRNRIGDSGLTSLSAAALGDKTRRNGPSASSAGVLANLAKLSLNHNQIGNEGIKAFTCAIAQGALSRLTLLSLEGNNIGDEGIIFFCDSVVNGPRCSSALEHVTKLYLHQPRIGDDAMKALATVITSGALASLKKAVVCSPQAKNTQLKLACSMRSIELV